MSLRVVLFFVNEILKIPKINNGAFSFSCSIFIFSVFLYIINNYDFFFVEEFSQRFLNKKCVDFEFFIDDSGSKLRLKVHFV